MSACLDSWWIKIFSFDINIWYYNFTPPPLYLNWYEWIAFHVYLMLWFNPLQNYAAVVNKSLLRNDRGWGIPIPGITHTSSLNIHMNYDVCKWNQIDVLRFFFNSQGFVTLNGSIKFIYLHFIEDIFLLWVIEIMLVNSLFLLQKNNSMI